jgi:nitrile hydratase
VSESRPGHLHDPEANVVAIESDFEYFRRKRLEPLVLHLARRGLLPLVSLLRAASGMEPEGVSSEQVPPDETDLDSAISALQVRLDAFVRGIATVSFPLDGNYMVIDDLRRERGDYDPFFRVTKQSFEGTLAERVAKLNEAFDQSETLLQVFTEAVVAAGLVSRDQLAERRKQDAAAGYWNGARIVARAWVDPDFKERLLTQGREVVRELDIPPGKLGILGVAENTEQVHNVVVCTLCSCYPWDLLGDPPWWYRSDDYRRDIVKDPRGLLRERFGLDVPPDVEVRVRDSTSDVRWMVLPQRPEGTEDLTEEELAHLVTSESLVGTARALTPAEARGGAPGEER